MPQGVLLSYRHGSPNPEPEGLLQRLGRNGVSFALLAGVLLTNSRGITRRGGLALYHKYNRVSGLRIGRAACSLVTATCWLTRLAKASHCNVTHLR